MAQLEHHRDYYMQPLLGRKPARAIPRSRGFSMSFIFSIFHKKQSTKNLAQSYNNAEVSTFSAGLLGNRGARSGSAPNVTLNLPGNATLNDDMTGKAIF